MQSSAPRICVAGIWHLGLVHAACFADMGHQVIGYDPDEDRVAGLNAGRPPIFEPGIEALLSAGLASGRLSFTADLSQAVSNATHVFVTFDTPVDDNDEVDLSGIFAAFEAMAPSLQPGVSVIVCSQVPVGTCEALSAVIRSKRPELDYGVACVPENLRLGQGIERFMRPDMIVLGCDNDTTRARVEPVYAQIESPRVNVDLRTAEMTKHAINSYLATMISFGNELANISDLVGADAMKVVAALKLEARVSPRAPLNPGLGFAGGTLARDMKVLQGIAREHDYEAPLVNGVLSLNRLQNTVAIRAIQRYYGRWQGLTIGLLGLTYKPGTSTIRRSSAIEMLIALTEAGATVNAYDPMADAGELAPHAQRFTRYDSAYDASTGADALVVATPWPEVLELDWARVKGLMKTPLLIDAGNYLKAEEMELAGFIYQGVGRGKGIAGAS
jgi:UDPglucose 6-dehydrogenase